jgi:formiminotetrahydrofolate cyclodeaminase
MDDFAGQPFDSLLEEVAAPRPAPGGGTSAGCACALAAALVEMAALIAGDHQAQAERLRALRAEALEHAERDLTSYELVLEARRLPRDDPARRERLEEALEQASADPLAIAEAWSEVAELGVDLAAAANPTLRGDALAGVLLAEAAATAAAALVEINLEGHAREDMLARARAAGGRAAAARAAALGSADDGATS